ncbi:MAG: hypothetical protein LJE67_09680 [Salaquimonas sp.]|nr:hypothetical protein [Salaquimonas sp.]
MLPIVLGVSYGLSEFVLISFLPVAAARGCAHAFAVVTPALLNFVLQKYIAFQS